MSGRTLKIKEKNQFLKLITNYNFPKLNLLQYLEMF